MNLDKTLHLNLCNITFLRLLKNACERKADDTFLSLSSHNHVCALMSIILSSLDL